MLFNFHRWKGSKIKNLNLKSKGDLKMKYKIFKTTSLLVILFSVIFLFSNSYAEKNNMPIPDHVCVYLNGTPVVGAKVNICNAGLNDNTSSTGCIGFSLTSGTYQIVANYGGYGGQTTGSFTPDTDYYVINLVSGNIGCDNN